MSKINNWCSKGVDVSQLGLVLSLISVGFWAKGDFIWGLALWWLAIWYDETTAYLRGR